MRRVVIVNDKMQQGYRYELSAPVGRDFDPPSLVALEYGIVVATTGQYPPGHPWPPEQPCGREDPHVEQPVVGLGRR